MKDPIEEKYHKQAEEIRKELEEEGKTEEKFGCLFFFGLDFRNYCLVRHRANKN